MIAALLTITSRWPWSATTWSTSASTSARRVTSRCDRCGAVTVGADRRRGLRGGGVVDVGAHHGGAGLGEAAGDGAAEPTTGAGHEGHPPGQVESICNGGHDGTLRGRCAGRSLTLSTCAQYGAAARMKRPERNQGVTMRAVRVVQHAAPLEALELQDIPDARPGAGRGAGEGVGGLAQLR